MSSTTSRAALYKPASGENVNVVTDLNNNWDTVDLNMNFRTCTSSTRPSTKWDGLTIHETDTRKSYVWNATPAVSGWYEIYTAETPLTQVNLSGASSGAYTTTHNITGDSNKRLQVRADGRLEWGPGNAATDTFVSRTGVGALTATGAVTITGDTTVSSTTESTAVNVSGGGTFAKSLTVGGSASLGGGTGVLNLRNATTAPTASPTTGIVLLSDSSRPQWYNSFGNNFYISGAQNGGTGTAVSNTTTDTVFATATIPINEPITGGTYRMIAFGNLTTSATATTIIISGNVNGGSSSFTLGDSTTDIDTVASIVNGNWRLEVIIRFTTAGVSGNVWLHGALDQKWTATSNATASSRWTGGSSGGATVDTTTTATSINLKAKWNVANASNTFTPKGWFLERLV